MDTDFESIRRRAVVIGSRRAQYWTDLLGAQQVALEHLPAATVELPSQAQLAVIDGLDLATGDLEQVVMDLRHQTHLPILAIYREIKRPGHSLRERRAALEQAGATDSIAVAEADISSGSVSAMKDLEFVTRVRALFLIGVKPRLLVIEDERKIADWVAEHLTTAGYLCRVAESLAEAQAAFARGPIDAMVVDRGLPDGDGLDFVRDLRARSIWTPALIFSAWNDPSQRVEGLTAGAHDYIGKPIEAAELLARMTWLLRPKEQEDMRTYGALALSYSDKILRWKGQRVEMRGREFSLLAYLIAREGLSIPQSMLLQDIWEQSSQSIDANRITQAKYRLTQDLKNVGIPPEIIVTEKDCYWFDPAPLLRIDPEPSRP